MALFFVSDRALGRCRGHTLRIVLVAWTRRQLAIPVIIFRLESLVRRSRVVGHVLVDDVFCSEYVNEVQEEEVEQTRRARVAPSPSVIM